MLNRLQSAIRNHKSAIRTLAVAALCMSLPVLCAGAEPAQPERSAPIVRLAQSDARVVPLEAYLVDKVNEERRRLNLRPLSTDSRLAEIARAHSSEMRDLSYFAHESPTTELHEPFDRYVLGMGSTPRLIAENIFHAWSTGPQPVNTASIDAAHASLMNSPGHRANILLPNTLRIGIGIITNRNGDIWVTEMFSRPGE